MRALASLIFILVNTASEGAELTPLLQRGELGVRIDDVQFPAGLPKELRSGLTNRILIRITLDEKGGRPRQRAADIAIRHDLWDENFTIVTRIDDAIVETITQRRLEDVIAFLEHIRLRRLFNVAELRNREVSLRAEMLLNPIERERMDKIRKWVAENSARETLDPAGALGAHDSSVGNTLFNKIFEQYASGADVAAVWQERLSTRPFTLDTLNDEER